MLQEYEKLQVSCSTYAGNAETAFRWFQQLVTDYRVKFQKQSRNCNTIVVPRVYIVIYCFYIFVIFIILETRESPNKFPTTDTKLPRQIEKNRKGETANFPRILLHCFLRLTIRFV